MISVRRSALLWITAMLTLVGVVAFAISYLTTRGETALFLDGQLRQIALYVGEGGPSAPEPPTGADPQDPEDQFVVSIWRPGADAAQSPRGPPPMPRLETPGFSSVAVGGESWRTFASGDSARWVQVAQRIAVREEIAQSAAIQAGLPFLAAIPLAWAVIAWSLRRAFAPLSALAADIAARGANSQAPIDASATPAEARPLVEAMNGLSARLVGAARREREFLADAAHELRTPLAALTLQVDDYAAAAGPAQREAIEALRGGVRRAASVAAQLLRMARLDDSGARGPGQSLDLAEVAAQSVADFAAAAESKGVDLGLAGLEPIPILGEPAELAMLFGNLVDNAVRHTPPGGSVDVRVSRVGAACVVEVADSGPGVAPEHLHRLTQRFFRAGANDHDGAGLGLAIAAAVAKRHGMAMAFENRQDRSGLRVRVSVPATPAEGRTALIPS